MHVLILDRSNTCFAAAISKNESKAVAAIFDKLETYFSKRGFSKQRKFLSKYRKELTVDSLSKMVLTALPEQWELFHLKDKVIV